MDLKDGTNIINLLYDNDNAGLSGSFVQGIARMNPITPEISYYEGFVNNREKKTVKGREEGTATACHTGKPCFNRATLPISRMRNATARKLTVGGRYEVKRGGDSGG